METTKHFIETNKLSKRLITVLRNNSLPGDVFEYVYQINHKQFLGLYGGGPKLWAEMEILLQKNNYLVKQI